MNFLKRFHIFEITIIIVVLGMHLYAALSDAHNMPSTWFTRDDAYYYFKVAQNITEGKGSTFDGINLTNGYHPLWMVVCIPIFFLARFDLILPLRVLVMVLGGFNAFTAILIYRFIKSNLSHAAAFESAVFWSFNAYFHYTTYEFGLETALAAFSIVLFIYKLSQFEKSWRTQPVTFGQIAILASIAVVVMFSRLDLIFLTFIAGIWIVFRKSTIRFFLPLDIVIIFISMVCSVALRTSIETYNLRYAASAIEAVMIALVIKLLSLYFFGAYTHPAKNPFWKTTLRTTFALLTSSVLTTILYSIFAIAGLGKSFPRSAFVYDFVISLILILGLRLAAYRLGNNQNPQAITPIEELKQNWKNWLTEGTIYYGIVGGALAFYMVFNKLMFGTTSPVSGQIKRWWGTLGRTAYDNPPNSWAAFLGIGYHNVYDAWQPTSNFFNWLGTIVKPLYPGSNTQDERYYIVMAVCALIVVIILLINAQFVSRKISNMALIPLIAGSGVQILSYTTTAYGGAKEWYWVGQMVLVVLFESLLLEVIIKPIQKTKTVQLVLQASAIILGVVMASKLMDYFIFAMPYNRYPANQAYLEVLPFLEENTPPGAVIGMTGGGNVGYFIHDRTIVNMDGLINSYDYFQSIQNKTAPQYLHDHGLWIVFANSNLLETPPYYGQFASYLQTYNSYGGKSLMYLLDKPKY
ncbi:MAG: hypothetical protein U0Z26_12240 [Anaerolineales bacterium]